MAPLKITGMSMRTSRIVHAKGYKETNVFRSAAMHFLSRLRFQGEWQVTVPDEHSCSGMCEFDLATVCGFDQLEDKIDFWCSAPWRKASYFALSMFFI